MPQGLTSHFGSASPHSLPGAPSPVDLNATCEPLASQFTYRLLLSSRLPTCPAGVDHPLSSHCLKGILNLICPDWKPALLPSQTSSTKQAILVNGNSILLGVEANILEQFLTSLFLTPHVHTIQKSYWLCLQHKSSIRCSSPLWLVHWF